MNQTPQRYYVTKITLAGGESAYLCCNGKLSFDLNKAKLFHSPQGAIRQGCDFVMKQIDKSGSGWEYRDMQIKAVGVLASVIHEQV